MIVRLVIISVATSAFRLVWESPCSKLIVISMAVNTKYAGSVIARVIRGIMRKVNQWYPAHRSVAAIAVQGGYKVCR